MRCIQIGLTISDLDFLEIGDVLDILTESANDGGDYVQLATQEDFDRF